MGSSPIARSIFLKLIWLFLLQTTFFFTDSPGLQAQVTTDSQRPFDQGQVIELPGTSEYLGDLSQEISVEFSQPSFHSVFGIINQQVDWSSNLIGTNTGTPQLLFEGIPYPFPSSKNLTWMPAFRNFDFLNFPAAAWWGPSSAMGAVQIHLPQTVAAPITYLGGWGGMNGNWGGEVGKFTSGFSLESTIQHGSTNFYSSTDTLNFLLGLSLVNNDLFELDSGFLGTQWFGSDKWYSLFGSMKLKTADFQSMEIKPFAQFAELNGLKVQELGSDLNYHFIMGGLVESQLGLGISHDDFSGGGNFPNLNKGYIQNLEVANVLGDFKLNMAFRMDFSSETDNMFSSSFGAQYQLGDFSILGSFSKGVDPLLDEDVMQGDLGARYQPSEFFSATFKSMTEMVENSWWTGGKASIHWILTGEIPRFLHKIQFGFEGQFLNNSSGDSRFDARERLEWTPYPLSFWFENRWFANNENFSCAGVDVHFSSQSKVFASLENLENHSVSWPDSTSPPGTGVWLGMETGI